MANSTDKEDGDMEVNSPQQITMQDVSTSPGVEQMEQPFDTTPCQVDRHLDFVAFNKAGHLLLGSSSLTGRYWGGSLWYYDNPSLAPAVEKCRVGYEVGSGLPAGVFLDGEKVLMVGQDNGCVEFLKIIQEDTGMRMKVLCRISEHVDAVSNVKVTCMGKTAITGSADMSIRVWDNETTLVTRILSVAHSQEVTGISPHPTDDHIFLSSGLDGNVLLWDLRCPKPASCIYRDWDNKPLCVSWVGNDDEYVVGLQTGHIALRSTNQLNHSIKKHQALKRPLYRIVNNPQRLSQIAVCGNDSKTIVMDKAGHYRDISSRYFNNVKILGYRYVDDRHKDFVRGLAWRDNDTLISCGLDSAVYMHNL